MDFYQRKFIEKRINFRVKNLNISSYDEYFDYLSTHPEELNKFLQKFLIKYTYFFRNYDVFEKLETILRGYVKDLKRPLRVWSAPCATGDEPYSIVMMLEKLKKQVKNFPEYEVVASDIDGTALEIAEIGIYGEYSLHETPENYISTYFSKKETSYGSKYYISNEIKEKVQFIEEDIIKGHNHNKKTKYDVIFCRNFFIYINRSSRDDLLKIFENHLVEGGFLIIGKTESLIDTSSNFRSVDNINQIYTKNKIYQNSWSNKETTSPRKPQESKELLVSNNEDPLLKLKGENKSKLDEKTVNISLIDNNEIELIDHASINPLDKYQIINSREKELKKHEFQIIKKIYDLNLLVEQLEEREIHLNQKEILIGLREKQIKHKLVQIEQREKRLEDLENLSEYYDQGGDKGLTLKTVRDHIVKPNIHGELNLPVGYYAVTNLHDKEKESNKFSIYGLSSGIGLIFKDIVNRVYAISHITNPKSRKNKNGTPIKYPHKFIDTSVKDLLDKILYYGANKENVEAIIIGGAKTIYDKGTISQKNIIAIKNELKKYDIKIDKELLGGISERSIIFDINENMLYVKKIWEEEYRKID